VGMTLSPRKNCGNVKKERGNGQKKTKKTAQLSHLGKRGPDTKNTRKQAWEKPGARKRREKKQEAWWREHQAKVPILKKKRDGRKGEGKGVKGVPHHRGGSLHASKGLTKKGGNKENDQDRTCAVGEYV